MHSLRACRSFTRRFSSAAVAPSAPKADVSALKRIGVVGAGQMGQGIGIVSAVVAKRHVTMVDAAPASLERSQAFIRSLLDKDVKKVRTSREAGTSTL